MTTASACLESLSARGITLHDDGNHLHWTAPKGAVTAEDLAELRQHKPELLAELDRRRQHQLDLLHGYAETVQRAVEGLRGVDLETLYRIGYVAEMAERGIEPVPFEAFRAALEQPPPYRRQPKRLLQLETQQPTPEPALWRDPGQEG